MRRRAYLTIGELEQAGGGVLLRYPRRNHRTFEYALNIRERVGSGKKNLRSVRFRCRCGNRQIDVWPYEPVRFRR